MGGERLVISDYDPAWPDRFREIAGSLRRVLGGEALRIDHIGSTAVPGLAAKTLIECRSRCATLSTLIAGMMRCFPVWTVVTRSRPITSRLGH